MKNLVVDFHTTYPALGKDEKERRKAYAEYVLGTVPENEIQLVREALQRGQLTGSDRFRAEIEKKLGTRLPHRRPDRPKEKKKQIRPL